MAGSRILRISKKGGGRVKVTNVLVLSMCDNGFFEKERLKKRRKTL
jgi:hypothetical protein